MGMGLGAHNLARLAEDSFERHGDYEAVYFEGKWHSSGELADRARLAQGLARLGMAPGDRAVVMTSNCPEVGSSTTPCGEQGAVVTPAIFLLQADDLRHILTSAEATTFVTSPEFLPTVQAAARDAGSVRWILSTGDDAEGVITLASLEEPEAGEIVPRDDSDLAALMFTGGTTGAAKGVMITHDNLRQAGKAGHEASYIPGITRTIVPLPLSHSYGLLVSAVGLHAVEQGVAVLQRWFDPRTSRARPGAQGAGGGGRAVHAADAARPSARGLRPVHPAPHRFRRVSPRRGGRARVRETSAPRRDPGGIRAAHRDRRARVDQPASAEEARPGRPPRARLRGTNGRRRRQRRAPRRARRDHRALPHGHARLLGVAATPPPTR